MLRPYYPEQNASNPTVRSPNAARAAARAQMAPTTLPVPQYPPTAQTPGRTSSRIGSPVSVYPTEAAHRWVTGARTPSLLGKKAIQKSLDLRRRVGARGPVGFPRGVTESAEGDRAVRELLPVLEAVSIVDGAGEGHLGGRSRPQHLESGGADPSGKLGKTRSSFPSTATITRSHRTAPSRVSTRSTVIVVGAGIFEELAGPRWHVAGHRTRVSRLCDSRPSEPALGTARAAGTRRHQERGARVLPVPGTARPGARRAASPRTGPGSRGAPRHRARCGAIPSSGSAPASRAPSGRSPTW